jgi:YHS domain-containing protein
MFKLLLLAMLSFVLTVGAMLAGCSRGQPGAQPNVTQEKEPAGEMDEGAGHEADAGDAQGDQDDQGAARAGSAGDQGRYEEALAELSPEDRKLAEEQKVCPVSGDPLGSMGKPYKVTVLGREVFLCCQGCESQIKADPEKYLAKLPE